MSAASGQSGAAPRLLMTADAVGGVWSFAMVLCDALARQGWAITLVTLGPAPKADQQADATAISGLDLRVTDLALDWMDPEGADRARAHRLLRGLEREVRPDLVHANGHREAAAGWTAPLVLTSHSCVASWWRACHGSLPPAEWDGYRAEVREALARSDMWVTPSQALAAAMAEIYDSGRAAAPIWNGIAARQSRETPEALVLAAGRFWDKAKNLAVLTDLAPELDWPLAVAGAHNPENGESSGGSEGPTQFLGRLGHEALLTWMDQASIFVAPSLYEPFGLAPLEAAQAGCALILSDIPAYRELWGGAALFVPPADGAALKTALQTLIADAPRRKHLRRQARIRANRFSAGQMAAEYLDVYGRLLAPVTNRSAEAV